MNSLVTLDTVTGDLTELHPSGVPPSPRAYHTFTVIGHMCYVFGGKNLDGVLAESDPTLLCAYDAVHVSWGAE